nr:MATE family efflux transporter [Polymorphobacter sp.]
MAGSTGYQAAAMHAATQNTQDHVPIRLRDLLTLAGPVVASRLGIMAMGLVDTLVVGRYSATDLGFLALAWAPTSIVLTTAIGLLSGVQVLTSQAIGAGRAVDTGAILRRGLVYAFWLGIAAIVVLAGPGALFLQHIGLDPALSAGAVPALRMLALSLLPILIVDSGIFWLEAHGHPLPGTAAMWGANAVNLALNLWLVPGHSGFPVAGAVASGCATLLSRTALLGFVAAYILWWKRSPGLGVFTAPRPERAAAKALRRVGYAASLSYAVESGAFASMTIVAGWLGATAVASWAIVINLAALIFMVPLGLATATAVLVGRAYGAGDLAGVRRAGLLGFGTAIAATALICAAVGLDGRAIAAAYTRDPAVQTITVAALWLSCLFYVSDGLQVVGAQSLRSRGDIWTPTATHFLSYIGVLIPAGYVAAIPLGLGVPGIVWGTIAASAMAATLLVGRFFWLSRSA